ncbi:MAG TPA: glycoside hydrolase family 9, partial [Verrucomicrobiae bacterium]|nr:glycoside hydrolase family 9 [Verrucomicrobiae bacterium]
MNSRLLVLLLSLSLASCSRSEPAPNAPVISDDAPLQTPLPGAHELRVISPSLLELTLITTKKPFPSPVEHWNFVSENDEAHLPSTNEFTVSLNGKPVAVKTVGFRRRVLYAPFKHRDLRIGNYLYLQLAAAVPDNAAIEVKNPNGKLWPASMSFAAKSAPLRWSPAIHVNQT